MSHLPQVRGLKLMELGLTENRVNVAPPAGIETGKLH